MSTFDLQNSFSLPLSYFDSITFPCGSRSKIFHTGLERQPLPEELPFFKAIFLSPFLYLIVFSPFPFSFFFIFFKKFYFTFSFSFLCFDSNKVLLPFYLKLNHFFSFLQQFRQQKF